MSSQRRWSDPRQAVPTWSVQDAKNRFSSLLEAAQSEPQTVTRHGKATAVIVGAEQYRRLIETLDKKKPTFLEMLLAMPKSDVELERMDIELRDVEF